MSCFSVGFAKYFVHVFTGGNGFLSTATTDTLVGMGVVDFAGCAVVHMSGGFTALFASIILGPRQGRFYNEEGNLKANPGLTKGHSAALQILGTMILWFGWYGYVRDLSLLSQSRFRVTTFHCSLLLTAQPCT